MTEPQTIDTMEDILKMLDARLREPEPFWDKFYEDRTKPVPFFKNIPDENLVRYIEQGWLSPGDALDLGTGPGRNAIYLATHGFSVTGLDLSATALDWATEQAQQTGAHVAFRKQDFLETTEQNTYDFIYDSGCFHHMAPHRRLTYVTRLKEMLRPEGYFGLTCFVAGGPLGGATLTDWEVYQENSLQGGLGYTKERLLSIFDAFDVIELTEMKPVDNPEALFGHAGLWTGLFRLKD